MENFFQDLKRKVRESISMGGRVTEVESNPNCPPIFDETILGSRELKWAQYRPAINIFARVLVHQHNKKQNANLKFVKVVSAHSLSCRGLVYGITLQAKDGEKVNVYETTISWNHWMDSKEKLDLGEVHLSRIQLLD